MIKQHRLIISIYIFDFFILTSILAAKVAALKPRFGSFGGGVKTGSGGKNDGARSPKAGK
jgi:hypothetical protein